MSGRLTVEAFDAWLDGYGRASRDDDADASAALFAPGARYFETPFAAPIVGRHAIREYWSRGARELTDKTSSHAILAVRGNVGIAHWWATFTERRTGGRQALDCLFVVEFDEAGQCSTFREWWHRVPVEADRQQGGA